MQTPSLQQGIQGYRRFINSYYFYEGLRVTLGVMLPVFIGIYFRHTSWGIAASVGALAAAITDFPGPLHHRINGMVAVTFCVFGITLLTGSIIHHPLLLGIFIALSGFAFAFITVFGNRASQIGSASLLILTLLIDETRTVPSFFELAVVTVVGAVMYLLISLVVHNLRPYKLVQQVLGECMQQTAAYIQIKAGMYAPQPDIEKLYQQLIDQQLLINQSQQNVREIMFKTRAIVKESTHTSRVLVLAFQDLVDFFDNAMASQPNYRLLQKALPDHPILESFQLLIKDLATGLAETGQAFAIGKPNPPSQLMENKLEALNQLFAETRQQELDKDSIEAFITLRHALDAIEVMIEKLLKLQLYSTYPSSIQNEGKLDYQRFVVPSYFSIKLLFNNLSRHSNVFRFSIRMMVAMVAGYIVSLYLPLGHAYWVLLTIVVILKPAYAITRQRNIDRLKGTFIGVAIGAAALVSTQNTYVLMGIMVGFMIASFSLWRHRYFWSVLTMTVAVVISMHLLHPGNYTMLLTDRIIDTVIGSVIAFGFTFLIPPLWEKIQLPTLAADSIKTISVYFDYVCRRFESQRISLSEYKLHRKLVYVALANFNDAFRRMTNEPKLMQEKAPYWQQMVVSTHVFASHIAALYTEILELKDDAQLASFLPIAKQISNRLNTAHGYLVGEQPAMQEGAATGLEDIAIRLQVKELLAKRRMELERGQWETNTRPQLVALKSVLDQLDMMLQLSGDIRRVCRNAGDA